MASTQDELNRLFVQKKSAQQLRDEDARAKSLLDDADKIKRALADQPGATHAKLVELTGLSPLDTSKALHHLMTLSLPFVEKVEIRDNRGQLVETKYHLTYDGKRSMPPPEPNWHSPDVDPRYHQPTVKKKKANGSGATFHLHKLNGKVSIRPDGSLKIRGQLGMVYDYIKNHTDCTHADIQRVTGIPTAGVYHHVAELTELGLITYDSKTVEGVRRGGRSKVRHYAIVPQDFGKLAKQPDSDDEPEPTASPVPSWINDDAIRPLQKLMGRKVGDDEITNTLQKLLDGGAKFIDIKLALNVLEDEYVRGLEQFYDSIVNHLPKD